jgi:hypothetical protein
MLACFLWLIISVLSLPFSSIPTAWSSFEATLCILFSWLEYFGAPYVLLGRASAEALPVEAAFYVAIVLLVAAITFAPVTAKTEDGEKQTFVSLRKHEQPPVHEADGECLSEESRQVHQFCLELSCYLLEASYQAYFPAQSDQSNDTGGDSYAVRHAEHKPAQTMGLMEVDEFISGPKLDLSRLGLRSRGVFSCSVFNTFGYLGRAGSEFIVAFRGSTLANILSDFKFNQIPLPDLHRPLSFFLEAFCLLECSGNPFASMVDSEALAVNERSPSIDLDVTDQHAGAIGDGFGPQSSQPPVAASSCF